MAQARNRLRVGREMREGRKPLSPKSKVGSRWSRDENRMSRAWEEDLFRNICMDKHELVEQVLKNELNGVNGQDIFGVFYNKNGKEREFIAYGAHNLGSKSCHRNGASPLHVAVWKNALKCARLLITYGFSTGKKDTLGVTAFDRATSHEMQVVLRRPPAARDLEVLSFKNGKALLQWTVSRSRPHVDTYEVREHVRDQLWFVGADTDVQVFARDSDRDGAVTCLYETPQGSIVSGGRHTFSVRCRNVDGFWSEWHVMKERKKANHWVEDWVSDNNLDEFKEAALKELDERLEQERKNTTKQAPKEKLRKLVVGCVQVGYVRVEEWFQRAHQMQLKSAVRIQAMWRARTQRIQYLDQCYIRMRSKAREAASIKIQTFFRQYISATRTEEDEDEFEDQTSAAYRKIMEKRAAIQRQKAKLVKYGLQKERERYRLMKACGFIFAHDARTPWK